MRAHFEAFALRLLVQLSPSLPSQAAGLGVRWRGYLCVTPRASSRARWEMILMRSGYDESGRVWIPKGEERTAVSRHEVERRDMIRWRCIQVDSRCWSRPCDEVNIAHLPLLVRITDTAVLQSYCHNEFGGKRVFYRTLQEATARAFVVSKDVPS